MVFAVGIDVGTSYTAAAVCRGDGASFTGAESVGLGTRATTAASVVFLGADGQWLVGDSAERRAHTQPELVIREFKRRLGDPVPMVVGGQRHKPEAIAATVVRWVVDRVAEQEGGQPAATTVTHPASWGSYKLSLLKNAVAVAGLEEVTFLSEPVAAAAHYASQARVGTGSTIAVYDLGGGTFDAAVVRKTERSFELLGTPQGIDRLGGMDFDQAVYSHLQAGASLPAIDPEDPDAVIAMTRLRRECTEAKEALSLDTEATIPVLLPHVRTRVRLVRAEFEDLVHDAVEMTVDALRTTIESAGVAVSDIDAVLLVGGSSRIPLVSQLISARLGRPVVVDADPKAAIALGAALVAASTVQLVPIALPSGDDQSSSLVPAGWTAPRGARSSRRKVGVVGVAAACGLAVVAGSAIAVGWPVERDGSRSVAEAGTQAPPPFGRSKSSPVPADSPAAPPWLADVRGAAALPSVMGPAAATEAAATEAVATEAAATEAAAAETAPAGGSASSPAAGRGSRASSQKEASAPKEAKEAKKSSSSSAGTGGPTAAANAPAATTSADTTRPTTAATSPTTAATSPTTGETTTPATSGAPTQTTSPTPATTPEPDPTTPATTPATDPTTPATDPTTPATDPEPDPTTPATDPEPDPTTAPVADTEPPVDDPPTTVAPETSAPPETTTSGPV